MDDGRIAIVGNRIYRGEFRPIEEITLAATSEKLLPSGCDIYTHLWVADKLDVVFSDGKGNWYHEPDKPIAAGNPISACFE